MVCIRQTIFHVSDDNLEIQTFFVKGHSIRDDWPFWNIKESFVNLGKKGIA